MHTRNSILRNACLPAALLLLGSAVHAQNNFFPTNTTFNSSNPVTGDATVGYTNQNDLNNSTNPTSPTVRLVSGGSVSGYLAVFNSSTANVNGGSVNGDLYAFGNSTVNVSGGSVGRYLQTYNSGTINLSGGNVNIGLYVRDSGTINLFGTGLMAPLVNANSSGFSQYSVSGTLLDGTFLLNKNLYVQNGTGAKFTLNNTPAVVPEPGFLALLMGTGVTGAGFLVRKRRTRK